MAQTLFVKQDMSIIPGHAAQLEIALENASTAYTAFQFDLILPKGISIKKDDEKKWMVMPNDTRIGNHILHVSEIASNTYRFLVYSMTNANILGSYGTLLTVTLSAEADINEGSYESYIENGLLVTDKDEITELESSTVDIQIARLKYFLTYKVDGIDYKTYEIEYGATITPEDAPTKEGYTFSGWSEIPETMPAHDVIVTGNFTINKYKLIYMVDGEEYKSYELEYGATITPEAAPTKEGYTFSGWSKIPETMPAKDVTVTGTFTVNKYKLTYMVDGEVYKSYNVEFGAAITSEPEPTKKGCIFSGWSEIPQTMPAYDVTVTGNFTRIAVIIGDVAYELNGDAVEIGKSENAKGDVKIESSVEINGQTYPVTTIGEGAFQGCTELTSVEIPSSLTTISENAFEGCTNLLVIKIGSGVREIESRAFANIATNNARTRDGDSGLHVYCEAESIPFAYSSAFEGTPIEKSTLHVVDDLVADYMFLYPWKEFGAIVGLTEDTGISNITLDSTGAHFYDMLGNRLDYPRKGLNIIREKDGRTRKIVVK